MNESERFSFMKWCSVGKKSKTIEWDAALKNWMEPNSSREMGMPNKAMELSLPNCKCTIVCQMYKMNAERRKKKWE